MKGCFSWFILLLFFNLYGYSQPSQYNVFNLNDNLSKGLIKSIATDNQGFIWCATDEGVVKYDGVESRFFKDELEGGYAKAFCRRKDGSLLVLHDLGLTEIVSQSDTTWFNKLWDGMNIVADTLLYYPKTIHEDKQGNIWIGENQSIVKYKEGKFEKYHFNVNPNYGIIFRTFDFTEDNNGNLWTISHGGQLFRYDYSSNKFEEKKLSVPLVQVNDLQFVGSNKLYAGTESGLFEINIEREKETFNTSKVLSLESISCGIIINENEYFIGTWDKGLYRAEFMQEDLKFEKVEGLSFEEIWSVFWDEKNGLWITSSEQTSVLRSVLFKTPKLREPNLIKSLQLTDNEELISSNENYITKNKIIDNNWEEVFKLFISEQPPTVAYQSQNRIWIGDLLGQIFYYDLVKNEIIKLESISVSPQSIQDIYADKKGNIWVAGNTTHGLIRISKNGLQFYYDQNGLKGSKVVLETSDGRLFAGGDEAENYFFEYDFNSDRFQNKSISLDFPTTNNFSVEDLVEIEPNKLWLATFDGILEMDLINEKIKRIDLQKVPIDEPTNAIAKSKKGIIWVATTSGLVAYSNEFSVLFNKTSGLPGNNFSNQGILVDEQDNLYVASPNGFGYLEETDLNSQVTPFPIFREIKVNGEKILYQDAHNASFDFQSNLEFEYLALSFPIQEVSYQTRILEIDSTWSSPTSSTKFLWTGLKAGNFTFQVRAQQKSGMLWSPPSVLIFSIQIPWYQKWWVILSFVLLGIMLIYLFARLFNLRLIRQNERMMEIIRETTEEVNRQNENYQKLQQKQYEDKLEYKNKQLTTFMLHLIQKNQSLKELQTKIFKSMRSSDKSSYRAFKNLLETIDFSFRNDEEWANFQKFFEEVHVGFFEKIKLDHPSITSQDLRHCALIRLNLTISEVATIMGISVESVKTSRFRLRKKMNIESQQNLQEYIMTI